MLLFNQQSAERMAKGLPKKLPIAGVEHVILVGSGKGGVGKSATAINIAIAIKQINKVGHNQFCSYIHFINVFLSEISSRNIRCRYLWPFDTENDGTR